MVDVHPGMSYHTSPEYKDAVSIPRVWLVAILRSLGGSIVVDQHQMVDADNNHNVQMVQTADPPTWIIRLGERLDD